MSFMPDFFSMFGRDPLLYGLAVLAIGAAVGIFLGLYMYRLRKTEDHVTYLNLGNMTGIDLPISEERSYSVWCDEQFNMPKKRFFKYWPGYNIKKGKNEFYKRFIGVEGNVFTTIMESPEKKTVPAAEWLKTILSSDQWKRLPNTVRSLIEQNNIFLTVGIKKPIALDKSTEKEMLPDVTEDNFITDAEEHIPNILGLSLEGLKGRQLLEKMAWLGTGFALCAVLFILKVLTI